MADFLRILNIGNTHVQFFDSAGPESFLPAGSCRTSDFDPSAEAVHIPALAAASVVPELTEELLRLGAFVVSGTLPLPFAPSDLDMTTVGADRIANAAALLDGPLPALSIDFGTAITFEFVTATRQFAGGAILPGRMLLRQALHDHTAQLPLVPLTDELPALPGRNTSDAIRIGTDHAVLGAVRELIKDWRLQCAPDNLHLTACGGDRKFFLRHIEGMTDGGDSFTVRGIRKLWEFHHAC